MPVCAQWECQYKFISKAMNVKVVPDVNRHNLFFKKKTNIKVVSDRHPPLKIKAICQQRGFGRFPEHGICTVFKRHYIVKFQGDVGSAYGVIGCNYRVRTCEADCIKMIPSDAELRQSGCCDFSTVLSVQRPCLMCVHTTQHLFLNV